MFHLFRALAERVKALFIANAGLDFEAQFVTRNAERKAELLRQSDAYEKEGLPGIAQELRQLADGISLKQPLASVLPSLDHWQAHDKTPTPALTAKSNQRDGERLLLTTNPKKKR